MAAEEAVVEVVEVVEKAPSALSTLVRSPRFHILAATVVSAGVGAGVTYVLTKNHFKTKYEELANREIQEAQKHYSEKIRAAKEDPKAKRVVPNKPGKVDVSKLVEKLGYNIEAPAESEEDLVVVEEKSLTVVEAEEDGTLMVEEIVESNIFDSPQEDLEGGFDYEAELARRKGDRPYLITLDEFSESEYDSATLTYYEEDDVLLDEQEDPIPDPDKIVGDDNLLRFGQGSKDKNVVYVRNDSLELDYEILRSKNSYAQDVLGYIQHEDRPGIRKFRRYDD